MTLLYNHLEQITTSAKSIGDLEFPPPKLFTNALLGHHEITTLIRDTEPHERSLFTIDPNVSSNLTSKVTRTSTSLGPDGSLRRKTVSQAQHRQGSAVAKVLGNDMLRQIQQSNRSHGRSRGVDVEILLKAAEKLNTVYLVSGAKERITTLRERHGQIETSLSHYEGLVLKQQAKLNRLNITTDTDNLSDEDEVEATDVTTGLSFTADDMRAEEAEIRELEIKKKALESRVAGMEKDLGGLLQ